MRKHSPGPWNRGVAQNIYQGERWDPSNQQRMIASCEPTTRTQEDWDETWANATLIAAAPDLLATLEGILLWDDGNLPGDMMDAARATVAKAKGEK